jgi:hypothetical protein
MLISQRIRAASRLAAPTMRAWLGLVAFDLALAMGFARAHERVRACHVNPRARAVPSTIDDIVWAVDEACVWYVKRVACLQRSAVATALLRQRGVRAALVIGYRAIPFESHAWVEVGGRVVNDRQQYRERFSVLERL